VCFGNVGYIRCFLRLQNRVFCEMVYVVYLGIEYIKVFAIKGK
jgi:hypothetical protein